jgi:tellurite resistance protein TerC
MLLWIGFIVLIGIFLALDLGVFNRKVHFISFREAAGWTSLWVAVSLLFGIFIYFAYENQWVNSNGLGGREAVVEYLSGYLVELSLSIDNIFVIALIFRYFQVPPRNQHRVLFWGILGAVAFRGILIGIGVILIQQFSWMTYVFGAVLLFAAFRMLKPDKEVHPEKNPLVRFTRSLFPVTQNYVGDHFFIRKMGYWIATPLFIALLVVEVTDIMFAFDSIPAIFAITQDPFLIFTSNIFAILGLRSMYFLLAAVLDRFRFLRISLVVILFYVAAKMLLHEVIHLPSWVSLLVIAAILVVGVIFSLLFPSSGKKGEHSEEIDSAGSETGAQTSEVQAIK